MPPGSTCSVGNRTWLIPEEMNQLICRETNETYPLDAPIWRSEAGGLLDLEFVGGLDPELVAQRPANMWRYREMLPLASDLHKVSFDEGMTPLQTWTIGGKLLEVKLDYLFPSGSYKDRGATMLLSQARALGMQEVVQDSSGNAGAAVATYAAKAGIACEIFVPAATSPAKLDQMRACGARLTLVPGNREATAAAALEAAGHRYYASHVWNPFFLHGTKTFAYELCEQRGWQAPDTLVLPAGNGTLLLGAEIGFRELYTLGLIDRLPRLVGVQAAGCAPLVAAWQQEAEDYVAVETADTAAEGIAIAEPRRGQQMLTAVRSTNGTMLQVEEGQIVETLRWLCQRGYFVEPTSAAVIAGAKRYLAQAPAEEQVATVLTGHGLKAATKIGKLLGTSGN